MRSHRVSTRVCPVPLCGGPARMGHLMCRACWATVPEDLQRQVNRTWGRVRKVMRDKAPLATMRSCATSYRQASDRAIAAVERSRP